MTFGMDAGWAIEGAVGSSYKIDATYLSSHLNMASRMMCAAKQFKVAILITQQMQELLSKSAKKVMRHIDTVIVKGSKIPTRVYTYDARRKGVDFFLNARKEAVADREADAYSENVWNTDADLREMRLHVDPEFEQAFSSGLNQYLDGNFPEALEFLTTANEIMVQNIVNSGRLENVNALRTPLLDTTDSSHTRPDVVTLRNEIGDGPSQALIEFIKSEDFSDPDPRKHKHALQPPGDWFRYRETGDWDGVRVLKSK